jgi:hypothetical protein
VTSRDPFARNAGSSWTGAHGEMEVSLDSPEGLERSFVELVLEVAGEPGISENRLPATWPWRRTVVAAWRCTRVRHRYRREAAVSRNCGATGFASAGQIQSFPAPEFVGRRPVG